MKGAEEMVTTLVGFLHLLVTVMWIGGMIFMKLVLLPALAATDPASAGRAMAVVAKRFTIIAWLSTLILLVTGLLKTPEGTLFSTASDYGVILLVKHILFVLMIAGGAIITFVFAPKLRSLAPKPGEGPSHEFLKAQKGVEILSATNTFLGLLVLVCVAMF